MLYNEELLTNALVNLIAHVNNVEETQQQDEHPQEPEENNEYDCLHCGDFVEDDNNAEKCNNCAGWYHANCVNNNDDGDGWTCDRCEGAENFQCERCGNYVADNNDGNAKQHEVCNTWYHTDCLSANEEENLPCNECGQ